MNKLVLIDGSGIAYRAFFALPLLNNDKGVYTNAVYGFTTMLLKIIETEKPTHMLVAFDAGKTTFRHKTFKEYKGTRQKTPPELSEQLPLIREMLDLMGIKRYEKELYEADDIIGTLSKVAQKDGWTTKVVTGDKDLLQLVDKNITVSLTRKGITEMDDYDPEKVMERYEIDPIRIIDLKGFMGDSSDNIPGVPGVGEKTAIKLLKQFGSLEAVYEDLESVSGKKLKEKLEANHEQAVLSKQLATIDVHAPVDIQLEDLAFESNFSQALGDLFKELEFSSLLDRIGFEATIEEETRDFDIHVELVHDITETLLQKESAVLVETLDENYHYADILGFSIVNEQGNYYVPKEVALASTLFKDWLEDGTTKKIVYDAKRDIVAMRWHGIQLRGIHFDINLASYLIDPSESNHDLAAIAKRRKIHYVYSDEAFYGKGAKQHIPEEEKLADHLVRKAHAMLELEPLLSEELQTNHQSSLFFELEMPLAKVLAEMEIKGVAINEQTLKDMGIELNEKLERLEKDIHQLAGVAFNINSPKQLGEILFEKLNLPVIKKTKTGYSTSADVLEKLQGSHDIIDHILEYRQLGKLNSTYIEGLLKVIHPKTNKIHTLYRQALTQTGRLSSTDPNLQNIPIRLEEGRKIRKAFVPSKKEWIMFAADYSQIELRVLAHIANDENLIKAFNEGMDIHTKTAMDVFGVKDDEVTSLMRRHAKAVNFGIVYGISDYGLSQSLNITRKEAAAFIEKYLDSYPGVRNYMTDIVQKAKHDGYVTTLLHRRRYLPEITSRNFNRRSFAERTAMNTPIQGSAADIIKLAMVNMAHRLEEEELEANMLLQVHDELIFEAPKHEIEKLKVIVPEVMESAIELKVPLKVEASYGQTWYDAK
ncbi:DNA polymerase-1 [Pullulanibacillus pueri]|uniref:DNA polymerase I n=1 Tax=Pullulanibacillus pueri TaxID=1437324 RepID=A0A8J2ZZX4_9BACL|nr:DNA polymerase I [Pullulanibacillus pueri]MBM7683470.1 DNA polymerase-1 [Pullulanibacillus pueri]GGH86775.1 DNA polymerase [Pullulanibacillus pueri]